MELRKNDIVRYDGLRYHVEGVLSDNLLRLRGAEEGARKSANAHRSRVSLVSRPIGELGSRRFTLLVWSAIAAFVILKIWFTVTDGKGYL